jgi:ABC-type multidrug transport system fused ATPase/permease subunit
MVDVELVFELLDIDEKIKEVEHPIVADITRGEIEFKNVTFTYDKKL